MPYKDKEQQRERWNYWKTTPSGLMSTKIQGWKYHGIISNDWTATYKMFMETTHCDKCKDLLSTDKKKNRKTKCLDHNHFITDSYNIRNVLCHACNNIDKVNNKSSVPNIRWREERKCWTYGKTINKERHQASFKYFIQAVIYKKEFETKKNIV